MEDSTPSREHLIQLLIQKSGDTLTKDEAVIVLDRLLLLYRTLIRKPPSDQEQAGHTSPEVP